MLLSFIRSPYLEHKSGIHNQMFMPEKYYEEELIDELLSKEGIVSAGNKRTVILTGEYIDSYTIPEKWVPLIQRKVFQMLYSEPSALKTEDGAYLLYPWHSQRQVPIEEVPQEITMVGGLSLEAWRPDINQIT
ncbi:MAG: hypothetical protein ACXAAI_16010 [Promethearchaeota archaeon]